MAQKPLSHDELKEVLELVRMHGSVAEASRKTFIHPETLRNRYRVATLRLAQGVLDGPPPPVDPMVREPLASFEEAWAQWQKSIGMMRERYAGPQQKQPRRDGSIKVLVIPDVHAPFHEVDMFAEMMVREADADKVICIGDLSDSYSLSTFTKYRPMSFDEEWAGVTACMQAMSEHFQDVEIIVGNHDARLEKRLRDRLNDDQIAAVKWMANGTLCPITALARRYPNIRVSHHAVPRSGESVDWFTSIGDAWLGHPERFSKTPGAALRAVEDWIADNEVALGLGRYRLICLGHTHAYSQFLWRSGQMLIEVGCLAQTAGYMVSPKIGGRPQRRGYVTFFQNAQGVTDLNSVRFHCFDVAS